MSNTLSPAVDPSVQDSVVAPVMVANPSNADISGFYDEFQGRMLRDYVYGNERVRKAIELVSSVITKETKSVLDVGCGIGTTSSGYVARHPQIQVVGVDISPKNIETAMKLSVSDRIRFERSEMKTTPRGGPFDVIAMIDMYEHIPAENRPTFHASIATALAENGTVVLTTPSRLHQEWLAAHEPEGLQIVDEIIDMPEILRFAQDIRGTVIRHEWVYVWKTNQYCHTVIARDPEYAQDSIRDGRGLISKRTRRRLRRLSSRVWDFRASRTRHNRVKEMLGMDVPRSE